MHSATQTHTRAVLEQVESARGLLIQKLGRFIVRICWNVQIHAIHLRVTVAQEGGSVSTMARKAQVKKQSLVKPTSVESLRTVPFESGFRFYTAIGSYTGITATSLNEFAAKLQIIPIESVTFHFQRKDFQHWIKDTIKDTELAEQINRIKQELPAEDLRKEIFSTVKARAITFSF